MEISWEFRLDQEGTSEEYDMMFMIFFVATPPLFKGVWGVNDKNDGFPIGISGKQTSTSDCNGR